MDKLLKALEGIRMFSRKARFRNGHSLLIEARSISLKGIAEGEIWSKKLEWRFGYDPIFRPKGFQSHFA